ncbi:hypothetical protein JW796_01520 [Candidatus Dojkabacteria bacterium]|nr:hypothetical protein [Candidatus Dojkabacteria bacterium]
MAKARFDKNQKIAGRDFYDIHKFFEEGILVNKAVVEERTEKKYLEYLNDLLALIDNEIKEKLLFEDINPLIETEKLNFVVKNLKSELKIMIRDEILRNKV